MKVRIETFSVQKDGNVPGENEDAAWPEETGEYEQPCVRVAVADGATECVFAGLWARKLVDAFGAGGLSHDLRVGLPQLRAGWQEWLAGKELPWYAGEKARQGTFATLLALELTADGTEPGGQWHAAAIGDSCLFLVRDEEVVVRFPLESPEDFDSRPLLLGTIGPDEACPNEKTQEGRWQSGDTFYLMTDALACWFLKDLGERGGLLATQDVSAVADGPGFLERVQAERVEGAMRNDDCTLVRVIIR